MHIVEVYCQSKRPTRAGAGIGIDPAADLRTFEREINQRLHAHRLGHIQYGVEGLDISADGKRLVIADGNNGDDMPYNHVRELTLP